MINYFYMGEAMDEENNQFYVVINGMDLTGKSTLVNSLAKNCKQKNVEVLRSSFLKNNPLNVLARDLRKEREVGQVNQETICKLYKFAESEDPILLKLLREQLPQISDEVLGHLYADAIAKELEFFKPTTSIIHDSSTIIKTLAIHRGLNLGDSLLKKIEKLMLSHPKPTKPEYSILLEASIDVKKDRLNKRINEGGYVSEIDKKVFSEPHKVEKTAEAMREITLKMFPETLVIDTTNMSEKEVFVTANKQLKICKDRSL